MHAVWRLLLDDDFMEAYEKGIIIRFPDGIERRLFPRFFTYSADYQEKYVCFFCNFMTCSYKFSELFLPLSNTSEMLHAPDVL
jgi:hypothetical protein